MRTITFKRNQKGVSPIIATLLLIVIAVAAAVVTYAFVTGFIGGATKTSTVPGSMSVPSYSITAGNTGVQGTSNIVIVYVENTGTKVLTLAATSVYLDGIQAVVTAGLPAGGTLAIGATAGLTVQAAQLITLPYNLKDGTSHLLKVVASDGTTVAISISS